MNAVFSTLFGHDVAGQAVHHELVGERDPLPLHHRGGPSGARSQPAPLPHTSGGAAVVGRARARRGTGRARRRGGHPAPDVTGHATGGPAGWTDAKEHGRGASGRGPRRGDHHRRHPQQHLGGARRVQWQDPGGALARRRGVAPGSHRAGRARRGPRGSPHPLPARRRGAAVGIRRSARRPRRAARRGRPRRPCGGARRAAQPGTGLRRRRPRHVAPGRGQLGPAPHRTRRGSSPIRSPRPWRCWRACTTSDGGASPRP